MSLNVHPLLVHFPIGLLTIYALLELVRWKRLNNQTLFAIKAFLVITGFAAACVTWLTGQLAENTAIVPTFAHPELVGIHSKMADLTIVSFGVLAAGYVVMVVKALDWELTKPLVRSLSGPAVKLTSAPLAPILAIVGLGLLLTTGGLGGVIVYGPHLDPFTNVLYQLFKGFAESAGH